MRLRYCVLLLICSAQLVLGYANRVGPSRALAAQFANGNSRVDALVGFSEELPKELPKLESVTPGCVDKNENCQNWAASGECTNNPAFMEGACTKSCGKCIRRAHYKKCEETPGACKRVFFDISINGVSAGRVIMDLFHSIVPRTVANFYELATMPTGGYKGTKFYRIIPGFMNQGGHTRHGCIYGGRFADENFDLIFDEPYLLGMANSGPNTNGDDYFITVGPAHHLDGKFVVYGTVVGGFEVVEKINALGTDTFSGPPKADIVVEDSGSLPWERVGVAAAA